MQKLIPVMGFVVALATFQPCLGAGEKEAGAAQDTKIAEAKPAETDSRADSTELNGPPFTDDAIEWDADTGKTVNFPDKGDANIVFSGTIKDNHGLSVNDADVEVKDGHFAYSAKLTESVNEFSVRVKIPNVGENIYRFALSWKKLPPEKQFKVKIKEGGKVIEKSNSAVAKTQPSSDWLMATQTVSRRSGRATVKQFELAAIGVLDSLGGRIFTAYLGWAPEYRINTKWSLGAALGVMLYKNQQGAFFPAIEYRVSAGRKFGRILEVEALVGAQSWFDVQGLIPMFGATFLVPRNWIFGEWGFLKYSKKLFVGYTYVAHASHAHLVRLGTRFAF